jgi:hypothetical protein
MKTIRRKIVFIVSTLILIGVLSVVLHYKLQDYRAAMQRHAWELSFRLCNRYLEHDISAEDFCNQLMSRDILLSRKGKPVKMERKEKGRVILKGKTDYSSTEIAVLYFEDPQEPSRMIMKPFIVHTDKDGYFDMSSVKPEAWRKAQNIFPSGSLTNLCYGDKLSEPFLMLYIRHIGFESRYIGVNYWRWYYTKEAFVCSLELLPEKRYSDCYKAFFARRYPDPYTVSDIKAHMEKCPVCPIADDAMIQVIISSRNSSDAELLELIKEFREKFPDGRDNTGLLGSIPSYISVSSSFAVPHDGTWISALDSIEAELYPKYYRKLGFRELASIIREKPENIAYVPSSLYDNAFNASYSFLSSDETEVFLDYDAVYLLCMGLTRSSNAASAIIKFKVKRAVPFIIGLLKTNELISERNYADILIHTLRGLTGEKLLTIEDCLSWWENKGSKMDWPTEPQIDLPEGWFDFFKKSEK